MSKTIKYGINGAFLGGATFGIVDAIQQNNEMDVRSDAKFDWKRFWKAVVAGGLVGGSVGAIIGAIVDYQNEQEKPINTDSELKKFAQSIMLDYEGKNYLALSAKADVIKSLLRQRYGDKIVSMPRIGSTVAGTALREGFDIDFTINFRPGSFRNVAEMFDSVYEFIESICGTHGITNCRRQRKSIGIFVTSQGVEHKIDIGPVKLSKNKQDGSGFMHVNTDSIFGNSSLTKTNVRVLNRLKLSPNQQQIVVILKDWKRKKELPLSSHLLQKLVLDAYSSARSVPRKFTSKIVMVLEHIVNNLNVAVIRSAENTNNVLTNISEADKQTIIDAAKEAIEDYRYQPNSIIRSLSQME